MDELEIWKFVVSALLGVCLAGMLFLIVVFSGVV
jgi:hypothetical protein